MTHWRQFWRRRYGMVKFRLIDILCITYFGLIGSLLIVIHKQVDNPLRYVLLHGLIVLLILELVRWGERNRQSSVPGFLRIFYPIALVLYGWSEIGAISRMLWGDFWATELIIRLDRFVFGSNPTVWFQQFFRPWLDEMMHFFYNSYFLFMPLVGLSLFLKRNYQQTLAAMALGTGVHLSNFVLFLIFPVLAPFMSDLLVGSSTGSYSGYLFYFITQVTQANGAQAGGTFPSCHVSAALAWALAAWRYQRRLGYLLLMASLGIGISAVYLGHHHAMDVIGGYLWASVAFPLILQMLKKRGEEPLTTSNR